MDEVLKYCARGVIQHLNGDHKLFNKYKNKAIEIYRNAKFEESCIYPIKDIIATKQSQEEGYR